MYPFHHSINTFVIFITNYCGSVMTIYTLLILNSFEMSFGFYIGYDRPFGPKEIFTTILYAIMTFLIMATVGMAIELVSKLYLRLDFTNAENIKILNGMHEGVLILSKPILSNDKRNNMF